MSRSQKPGRACYDRGVRDPDETPPETRPRPKAAWDPQPGEEPRDHDRFQAWLASGLTVAAWARREGMNEGTVRALSARYRWLDRRTAYAAHLRAISLTAAEHEARDRGVNLATILDLGEDLVIRSMEHALANLETLRPRELAGLVKTLADLRALAEGRATSRVDITTLPPEAQAFLARHAMPTETTVEDSEEWG